MNGHRYLVLLLCSFVIVVVLSSILLPIAEAYTPLLQAGLAPTAFVYLPYVANQYPPATGTPTKSPTNTPTPTVTPTPGTPVGGQWSGTTDQGHSINLTVSTDGTQVSRLNFPSVDFDGPCGKTTSVETGFAYASPIISNSFTYASGLSLLSVNGIFTSSSYLSGTYTITITVNSSGTPCTDTHTGTWNASPSSSGTPTPTTAPVPHDGNWSISPSGTLYSGWFKVSGDEITEFSVWFHPNTAAFCWFLADHTGASDSITNNDFSFSDWIGNYTASGHFTSGTTATGSINVFYSYGLGDCNLSSFSYAGNWNATRTGP